MSERDDEYYRIKDMQGEHIFKISEISYVSPVKKYGDIAAFHVVAGGHIWGMKEETTVDSVMFVRQGLIDAMLRRRA